MCVWIPPWRSRGQDRQGGAGLQIQKADAHRAGDDIFITRENQFSAPGVDPENNHIIRILVGRQQEISARIDRKIPRAISPSRIHAPLG